MSEAIFPLRVWIEDTDYGGVVYHANYLKFFERARSVWVESLGMGIKAQEAAGVLFAVKCVSLDYKKPARLGDQLEVLTRVTRTGRASVDFSQYIRLQGEASTVLCVAETRVVCVTPEIRSCGMPEAWRNNFVIQPRYFEMKKTIQ